MLEIAIAWARSTLENVGRWKDLSKIITTGAEYLLKTNPSPRVLYAIVGDPEIDHQYWGRPQEGLLVSIFLWNHFCKHVQIKYEVIQFDLFHSLTEYVVVIRLRNSHRIKTAYVRVWKSRNGRTGLTLLLRWRAHSQQLPWSCRMKLWLPSVGTRLKNFTILATNTGASTPMLSARSKIRVW